MRLTKILIFYLFIFLLVIPAIQRSLNIVSEKMLNGYGSEPHSISAGSFSCLKWFTGQMQDSLSLFVQGRIGFRNTLIRINNQIDYTLFGIIHAKGFAEGLKGYLFEEDYIHEYNGDYFIGRETIDKKLSRLKNVEDSLNKHDTKLLVIYEPGKASYYPEFIPARFHPEKRGLTNHEYFLECSAKYGLSYLDLNSYFLKMKDTASYPLFTKYGMHWSLSGVPFAVDTLIRLAEYAASVRLPHFRIRGNKVPETPQGTDNDIGELLNLLFPLQYTGTAVPEIEFEADKQKRLSVLIVADSYYINIVEEFGNRIFQTQEYWYYNERLYPFQHVIPPRKIDKRDLRNKLLTYNLILLMVSEINLHCGFWNFADEAYLAFHPGENDDPVYTIENEIRNERSWFGFLAGRAKSQKMPLDSMIRLNAEFTYRSRQNQ